MKDQLQEMESMFYPATDLLDLSNNEIRRCEYGIMYATSSN